MSIIAEDPEGSGEYTVGGPDPIATTRWALPADVLNVTGLTVDVTAVNLAVLTLETVTGLIESIERPDISARDRHYLKLMTCYQVAFMKDNPDLFTRADVTSASQDGDNANFRNVDSHLFAPLARKAMRRLSWRAVRALIPGGGVPSTAPGRDINSDSFDDSLPWGPL